MVFAGVQGDAQVRGALANRGIALHTGKDHVLAERDEVLTAAGTPFSVFTPYKNAWLRWLAPESLHAYPVARHAAALAPRPTPLPANTLPGVPALEDIGFQRTNLQDRKSTRLNSSHLRLSRMPSSA